MMHLSDYMTEKNLTDAEVAASIGVTRPTVSRIRRKLVRPDWATIRQIEAFTEGVVTASDFTNLDAGAPA